MTLEGRRRTVTVFEPRLPVIVHPGGAELRTRKPLVDRGDINVCVRRRGGRDSGLVRREILDVRWTIWTAHQYGTRQGIGMAVPVDLRVSLPLRELDPIVSNGI